MDRKSNHPSLDSPTGDENLTDETGSHKSVQRSQNCVRALMFGKAPLSITQKINENNTNKDNILEFHKNAQHDHSSLKRKQYDEEHNEANLEAFSPSVKHRKVRQLGAADTAKNNPHILTSPECGGPRQVVTGACAAQEKLFTGIDNSGFNFHNSLQADWSLPCFKAVENHNQSPRMSSCQKNKSGSNQNQIIQNGCSSQNKDRNSITNGLQPFDNNWSSPNRTFHTNDQEQSVNVERYPKNFVNQQQLLQSLQLEGCQGELMVLPHVEMTQNGPVILFQQAHLPSNVKFLPPSTEDITSQNDQSLPSSLNQVSLKHPQGSVISHHHIQHIQQRQNTLQLNSSGEEMDSAISAISAVDLSPQRPPYPSTLQKQLEQAKHAMRIESPIFGGSDENDPSREQHNQKERIRRARIRDACHLMRQLVPGMSDKTDKATVFEFAARYVHFLKAFVGEQYDKDFLMKYSPY